MEGSFFPPHPRSSESLFARERGSAFLFSFSKKRSVQEIPAKNVRKQYRLLKKSIANYSRSR